MNDIEVEEIVAEPDESTWVSTLVNGYEVLIQNAWFIVAAAALAYYVWKVKLSCKYYKWKEDRKYQEISAKSKKDPEILIEREEARLTAIRKLQEDYNQRAIKMKEIQREKENKKREDLIQKAKPYLGGRKLNDNYFPLSGSGSKGYVAPTRRTGCPGHC